MYFVQYFTRVVETIEKGARPPLLAGREQTMLSRDIARVSRKTIRTEYFTAYRSDEFSVFSVIAKPKQAEEPALSFLGRSYCGCHELLSRLIAPLSRRGR
jgi:hypothetical protein